MPFLTDVDERAQVKGSRDPLGLVPIWSRFGREVVGNLTTVTNTVRGFTTLLLGLYFAEEVQNAARDDAPSTLDTFLKFEQMAGYARVRYRSDRSVRGWRRINARLDRKRVPISATGSDQILSNQKVYGLWGLFSMPARASELLQKGEQRLTPAARAFVESHYVPMLPNGPRPLVDALRKEGLLFDVESELAQTLGRIHGPLRVKEKEFYDHHLADGGDVDTTAGRQQALSEILRTIDSEEFGFAEFHTVRRTAEKKRLDALADSLERIETLEHLIMPARVAFGYVLTQNNRTVDAVARALATEWKRPPRVNRDRMNDVRSGIAHATSTEAATRWMQIADLISAADYASLIRALVDLNAYVMQMRNESAAWVKIERGTLRVTMPNETESLIPATAVENLWGSTYFINSLWNISREVA